MKKNSPPFDMEQLIGYVLLAGVVVSAVLIVAGLAWTFMLTGHAALNDALRGVKVWHFWMDTARAFLRSGRTPILWVNGGIAALLLTPYLRVLASLLYFAFVERNVKFIFFTGIVLAILTHSLFLR